MMILLSLIVITAILTVAGKYQTSKKLYYLFKPFTLILILVCAFEIHFYNSIYGIFIFIGLIFSLCGDIFLMFERTKFFLFGLVSFFITHLFYIISFIIRIDQIDFIVILPFMLYSAVYYKTIKHSLRKLKYPVIIYISAISVMGMLGVNQLDPANIKTIYGLIGSISFIISDSFLGLNKFYKKSVHFEPVILSTYYFAQILFVFSV